MTFIGLHRIQSTNAEYETETDCIYDCVDDVEIFMAKKAKKSSNKLKKNFKSEPLDKTHRIIYNEYGSAIIENIVLLKMRSPKTIATLPKKTLALLLKQRFLVYA